MGQASLADALRARSRTLHRQAERSGVLGDLIRGRAGLEAYLLLLRNLLPVYRVMEAALERRRGWPAVGPVARRAVFRGVALERDLAALHGPGWRRLPLLPEGRRYARRVSWASRDEGVALIAHAYTRYLGDLNGGRILRRLLADSLGLPPSGLAFYDYPEVADAGQLASDYRRAVDTAGSELTDWQGVLDEVEAAFRLNIDLSRAVQGAAGGAAGRPETRSGAALVVPGTAVGVPQ